MIKHKIKEHSFTPNKWLGIMKSIRDHRSATIKVQKPSDRYQHGRAFYFITGIEGAELIQERISWLGKGTY